VCPAADTKLSNPPPAPIRWGREKRYMRSRHLRTALLSSNTHCLLRCVQLRTQSPTTTLLCADSQNLCPAPRTAVGWGRESVLYCCVCVQLRTRSSTTKTSASYVSQVGNALYSVFRHPPGTYLSTTKTSASNVSQVDNALYSVFRHPRYRGTAVP
jgi:hypothetical protein